MIVEKLRDQANLVGGEAANVMREAAARIEVALDAATEGIGEQESPRRLLSALKRVHYALLVEPKDGAARPNPL